MTLQDCTTLEQLAAYAASHHIQSIMPHDWLPLLKRAAELSPRTAELEALMQRVDNRLLQMVA